MIRLRQGYGGHVGNQRRLEYRLQGVLIYSYSDCFTGDISFFSVAAVRDRGAKPAPWARSPTSRRSATGGVMRVRKMVTGINQHTLKPGLRTEGAEDSNVSNRNQDVTEALSRLHA